METLTEPIAFSPLYMDRVWGGRMLDKLYGRELPPGDTPIGESWELVDREGEQSVVSGGTFAGKTLHDLWTNYRDLVFGKTSAGGERFPLLVKILDARDELSIQVHPPADIAEELGGEPKTEMWYIAQADEDAALYVGLKKGVSREDFERGIAEGLTAEQVHRIPAREGEFIFIPSGRLHAIGAGLLIFEIQQNSDTTYRVFDWNRVGLNGTPRELHVEQSLRCIDFEDIEPAMDIDREGVLVDCPFFGVARRQIARGEGKRPVTGDRSAILTIVDGRVGCGASTFGKGDFFLVPPGELLVEGLEDSTILVSTLP